MLNEPTIEKLRALRLGAMVAAWEEQQRSAEVVALGFDERLAMLVEAEWCARENKRVGRSLKEAKLRLSQACIEDVQYSARRELDKAVVRQLASCRWVREHQAVLITGSTGTGKTYLACALAHQACRSGFRASYRRAPRLFDELRLARADGSYPKLLARFARVDVLVIDDFAIAPIADTERRITASSLCAGTSTLTKGRRSSARASSGALAFSQRQRKIKAVSIHMMLVTMG